MIEWIDVNNKIADIDDLLVDLHQQMALIKEAEANGICKHSLSTLPTRYDNFMKTQKAINASKQELISLITECEITLHNYSEALKTLEESQISQWQIELNINFEKQNVSVLNSVKNFLQNSGQSNMIMQCEQLENEIKQLTDQQMVLTNKCIQNLRDYGLIIAHCSPSYLDKHKSHLFLKCCKSLLNTTDVNVCNQVFETYMEFINLKNTLLPNVTLQFSYNLHLLYNDINNKVSNLFEQRSKMENEEPILMLEKLYNDAKAGISTFLQTEKGSSNAFEFVLVGELLLLNQSFLQLENAVYRSGDWLIKLTSREGNWFLEELILNSNRTQEFINCLSFEQSFKIEEQTFGQTVAGVRVCHSIYKTLQEMNNHFHTIILPESIKKIQIEEPSVLQIITDLNNIINVINLPLSELVNNLEKCYNCIVMEMDDIVSSYFIRYL